MCLLNMSLHHPTQDKGSKAQSSKTIEMQFSRALDEAVEAYRAHRTRISQRDRQWSEKSNLVSLVS